MRIGIDYHPAVAHVPGVGRYARELVRALVALERRPDLALYDVGRAPRAVGERALGLDPRDRATRRLRRRWSRRALAALPFGLGAADRLLGGVDLFHHVLADGPPVARAPQTLALSDLPEPASDADRALAARLAQLRGVVVFSSAWQELVAGRYGVPRDRIHRVPVGCEHWRRELAELPPRDDPPVVLALGSLVPRRRHLLLLRAAELAAARGLRLRLRFVGRSGPTSDELRAAVAASTLREDVRWDAELPEAEMPDLVARAGALVHLDEHAGTPVTPLEALALGTPVVASRAQVFEEALGPHAEYVDEAAALREPEALAAAIERALASSRDPAACAERELAARAWSWERSARLHVEAWTRSLG